MPASAPSAYPFELSDEIDLGRDIAPELIEQKISQYSTDLDLIKETINTRIASLTVSKVEKG